MNCKVIIRTITSLIITNSLSIYFNGKIDRESYSMVHRDGTHTHTIVVLFFFIIIISSSSSASSSCFINVVSRRFPAKIKKNYKKNFLRERERERVVFYDMLKHFSFITLCEGGLVQQKIEKISRVKNQKNIY